MLLSYVYKKIIHTMNLLSTLNFNTTDKHQLSYNQKKLHEAYNFLDDFKSELIREKIKSK